MQLDNLSSRETALLTRALAFVRPAEMDPALTAAVRIVKTDNFADECDQVARYYAPLGLETPASRPVFDKGRNPGHRILLNNAAISGLSFLHTLVGDLVHLANLCRYSADHGNVYRFTQEQAIVMPRSELSGPCPGYKELAIAPQRLEGRPGRGRQKAAR